jgi:hypothetical protein
MFECPYQFKMRFLYGFNPPLHEALGYGKGIHDALAELHKRAIGGEVLGHDASEELVDRHLHTPYAYRELENHLPRHEARNAHCSRCDLAELCRRSPRIIGIDAGAVLERDRLLITRARSKSVWAKLRQVDSVT